MKKWLIKKMVTIVSSCTKTVKDMKLTAFKLVKQIVLVL